mgnify:CR=1 FL=1
MEVDVYKAGVYKSAPEAFLFGAPSEEALEAQRGYLEPAWRRLTTDIESARGARTGAVNAWIDQLVSGGGKALSDPLGALKDAGLVTGVMTRDAFVEHAAAKFGSTPTICRSSTTATTSPFCPGFPPRMRMWRS